ncbi:acyltransferase (plasmid) [Rhizobium ruizarguesonis]|uniref:Acyltransferase n=2 Tax=Rhizobium ruizarguesonis TaxID=2081791 RepID=A0ABY1X1R1_9HYPH|nr:acyltransferase [Rhizobium ruizarguesonis]TAU72004.1 acyltransferase [Rhizobium ruizarguesonis]TAV03769.1 acyltransferase [Rhizobium ruizarguesonis]TAV23096.1 acyltransferase [Rhizobium ruizarguesonis]TAV23596.1 acyltransferase [Rhizobium ruizarguesonis]
MYMNSIRNPPIYIIQVIRAFAAIIVVIHHSIRAYTLNPPGYMVNLFKSYLSVSWFTEALAFGVDVFFVISGFIMVYVSTPYVDGRKPPLDFLVRRIERIYPPYLIATAVLLILTAIRFGTGNPDFSLWRIVTSSALWPTFNSQGLVQPILGVGWTLSFEMYFYLVFFLSLSLQRTKFLPLTVGIIVAVWLAASTFNSQTAIGSFLKNPIVLEFLFGCGIAAAFRAGRLPKLHGLTIVASILIVLVSTHFQADGYFSQDWRVIYWGMPAALIIASSLQISFNHETPIGRLGVFLGNASYSIYLMHIAVIYLIMTRIYPKLIDFGVVRSIDQAVAMAVIASIAFGAVFHILVEKPINDWRHKQSPSRSKTA